MPSYPKPREWYELHAESARVYDLVKRVWVPGNDYTFATTRVDTNLDTLTEPAHQAAFILRRLQALYLLTKPGVPVGNLQGQAVGLDLSRLLQEFVPVAHGETADHLAAFAKQVLEAALKLRSPDPEYPNEGCTFI